MAERIILITGGERSGKSRYAEEWALEKTPHPVYLATARIWDEEFRQRVRIHQERRKTAWRNLEEEKYLSRHDLTGETVVVDCVTLWATNFFFDLAHMVCDKDDEATQAAQRQRQTQLALEEMKQEFDRLTQQQATLVFVTNEIGLGGISADPIQRSFTDLLGWINQYIAARAQEIILMVSGIPVTIKKI